MEANAKMRRMFGKEVEYMIKEFGPRYDAVTLDALRRRDGERADFIAMADKRYLEQSRMRHALLTDRQPTSLSLPAIRALVTSVDFPDDEVLAQAGVSTFLANLTQEGARKLVVCAERIAFGHIRTLANLAHMFSYEEISQARFEALLTEDLTLYQGVVQLVRKGLRNPVFREGVQMYIDGQDDLTHREEEVLLTGREKIKPRNTDVLKKLLRGAIRETHPQISDKLFRSNHARRNPRHPTSYGIYGDPGR